MKEKDRIRIDVSEFYARTVRSGSGAPGSPAPKRPAET